MLLMISLVIAVLCTPAAAGSRAASLNVQDAPRPTEGKYDPGAIPDYIAHDAFLRSLVARPDDEEGGRRATTFAEDALSLSKAGERTEKDRAAVKALLAAAARYVEQVSAWDAQVKTLKDESFPEPSREVMAKLADLQRQKAALAVETMNTLDRTSPITADDKAKILRHIADDVKRGITFVVPEKFIEPKQRAPCGTKQGKTSKAPTSPAAPTPVTPSYMGESYTYTRSSYAFAHMEIYGYGLTAESYTSRGHTYQTTVETRLDDGYAVRRTDPEGCCSSPPTSITIVIPMLRDGVYFDGTIETETTWTGHCPTSCATPAG